MCSPARRSVRAHLSAVGALCAALVLVVAGLAPAEAADGRLERAQRQRMEVQERLDGLLQRLRAVEAKAGALEQEVAALQAREQAEGQQAQEANSALASRVRESYIRGNPDPALALLASGSPDEARAQARLLGALALRSRAEYESASAARVRTRAAAEEVAHSAGELRARQAELDDVRGEIARQLAAAQREEERVREQIAAEQAERERQARERERKRHATAAAERAARQRVAAAATRSSRDVAGPARVSGGVACPVGSPRSYSDTWGAPRSGGRRHKGTDILAPRGTPIYAYEDGTVTRMTNSRLGGITLYLRGDGGNLYYYAHMQGYASGLSAGQRVSVGEHIGANGDTGNARGVPHLHFEVKPGGGGNVNPYPYVVRACG